MTDTPKDLHFAIWELLTKDERPRHVIAHETEYWGLFWICDDMGQYGPRDCPRDEDVVHESTAHRAIRDAAREVLDLAGVDVYFNVDGGWTFASDTGSMIQDHSTRTEAIYRALKWLREEKK